MCSSDLDEFRRVLFRSFALPVGPLRERLLQVRGIGPETADAITLYAAEKPVFVVDAYTFRILLRHNLVVVGITIDDGLEVLLHLGVDTVELKGRPFALTAATGQRVRAGESLGTMDLEQIRQAGKNTTAIVAVTNSAAKGVALELTAVRAGRNR